jgi:hypothetical protein
VFWCAQLLCPTIFVCLALSELCRPLLWVMSNLRQMRGVGRWRCKLLENLGQDCWGRIWM